MTIIDKKYLAGKYGTSDGVIKEINACLWMNNATLGFASQVYPGLSPAQIGVCLAQNGIRLMQKFTKDKETRLHLLLDRILSVSHNVDGTEIGLCYPMDKAETAFFKRCRLLMPYLKEHQVMAAIVRLGQIQLKDYVQHPTYEFHFLENRVWQWQSDS
jgi:hypothetical protein